MQALENLWRGEHKGKAGEGAQCLAGDTGGQEELTCAAGVDGAEAADTISGDAGAGRASHGEQARQVIEHAGTGFEVDGPDPAGPICNSCSIEEKSQGAPQSKRRERNTSPARSAWRISLCPNSPLESMRPGWWAKQA